MILFPNVCTFHTDFTKVSYPVIIENVMTDLDMNKINFRNILMISIAL